MNEALRAWAEATLRVKEGNLNEHMEDRMPVCQVNDARLTVGDLRAFLAEGEQGRKYGAAATEWRPAPGWRIVRLDVLVGGVVELVFRAQRYAGEGVWHWDGDFPTLDAAWDAAEKLGAKS